jgi:hypothetical protein
MRRWKWIALAASGGMLLQVGSCATDFLYYVLQALATQFASALVTGAAGTA